MGAADIQVVIDWTDPRRLAEFWTEALGYVMQPPPPGFDSWENFADQIGLPSKNRDGFAAAVDPEGVKPRILFQKVPKTNGQERVHLDIDSIQSASHHTCVSNGEDCHLWCCRTVPIPMQTCCPGARLLVGKGYESSRLMPMCRSLANDASTSPGPVAWPDASADPAALGHDVHVQLVVQPAPLHVHPTQLPAGAGMAAATRWPSNPPASSSPTVPRPAIPTITVSAEPPAPKASPPPAAQTAPAASTVGAATRLAATKAASERSVAGVRTPANRLRGSRCRQPSRPTVISPLPVASSTTPRSADAATAARIPAAKIPSTDPLW